MNDLKGEVCTFRCGCPYTLLLMHGFARSVLGGDNATANNLIKTNPNLSLSAVAA